LTPATCARTIASRAEGATTAARSMYGHLPGM
jgi:hypothetical protein